MTDPIPATFQAFRIRDDEEGYRAGIESQSIDDQNEGDVTVRVAWSSVNFKDALAGFLFWGGGCEAGSIFTTKTTKDTKSLKDSKHMPLESHSRSHGEKAPQILFLRALRSSW